MFSLHAANKKNALTVGWGDKKRGEEFTGIEDENGNNLTQNHGRFPWDTRLCKT